MTDNKEEKKTEGKKKKTVTVRKADGTMVTIEVDFRAKPDRLFKWDNECRRGIY